MEINVLYHENRSVWLTIISDKQGKRLSEREFKTKEEIISYLSDWGLNDDEIKKTIG